GAMKNLLIFSLGVLACLTACSTSWAGWGKGCSCCNEAGPVYSSGPEDCCACPCEDCGHRGLLGRIKDCICHTSHDCGCAPCAASPCCSSCNTCCEVCPTTCCSCCDDCCPPLRHR